MPECLQGSRASMPMPVMDIGKMRVRMRDRRMHVTMRMRFIALVRKIVFVPMMLVMPMRMRVLDPVVRMFVLVTLAHMQDDADRHQHRGDPECDMRPLGP